MNKEKEMTAPVVSVDADTEQSSQNLTDNSLTDFDPNFKGFDEMQREILRMMDPSYLKTVSMSELLDNVYQSKPPLVDGLLYRGTYLFVGAPKLGKSFLMTQLAYHISTGTPLWNYPVRKGTVLYLALDVDQITANVIANSIYEFDGKGLVKFDLMNKIFKGLVDAGLIDPEILQSPLGIYEDAKNHKIIHNLYSFNGNTVKKTMTVDECKNFQKWFYDKIVNQVEKD